MNTEIPYTTSLPVITPQRLSAWHRRAVPTFQAKISAFPMVLGTEPDDTYEDSLFVWRRQLPVRVQEFVAASIEILGRNATLYLHNYFEQFTTIHLNDEGQLVGEHGSFHSSINSKDIARLYRPYVADDLAAAFSEHLVDSIATALAHLPRGTALKLDDVRKYDYTTRKRPFYKRHFDNFENLMLHYSDPGTPYLFDNRHFRTIAGDVTLHGKESLHGFATAPSIRRKKQKHLCIAFEVLRPQAALS